ISKRDLVTNQLKKCCKFCLWDQSNSAKAIHDAFSDLSSLITMLLEGNSSFDIKLNGSDIFTALQLIRLLQIHYKLFDINFYKPHLDYVYYFYNYQQLIKYKGNTKYILNNLYN